LIDLKSLIYNATKIDRSNSEKLTQFRIRVVTFTHWHTWKLIEINMAMYLKKERYSSVEG